MIVTLCASASHPHLIRQAAQELTLAGHLVWTPEPLERSPTPDEEVVLDRVHREKIRRSDLVVIIRKPDGTIGESVASEAAYAHHVGVQIRHL